ncbi:MAG: hypothetical protein Fur0044_16150 [Anaerolineae bacterium]|nr:hypothetical protein [Anaerolineales bacterium]MCQ3978544.1 hypothetical protein [Anaerolineae bacterium]
MATQQIVPVVCANCRTQFNAPVVPIIDGQNPALKSAFLQGRFNAVQCPQCGFVNPLNLPMFYYDLEKELALVLSPNSLSLSGPEQDKIIGSLTNSVVNSLPAEQRKFYLLNPKLFLTFDSIVKAVLEADGITEEVLETQKAKVKLLEEFLQVRDEAALQAKVKEHDAELDRDFFEILTASMQAAQMEGNRAGAQALYALRSVLAQLSSQGQQAVTEIDNSLGLVHITSREDLLEKLQNASGDEEFEAFMAAGHPLLDYTFFQQLTAQIDELAKAGNGKQADALKNLRTKILDTKAQQEEQSRAALQKSVALLREILQSRDPQKVLADNLDQIDEPFFAILSANIEEARRQNQNEAAQAMEMIGNMAMAMLQESMANSA